MLFSAKQTVHYLHKVADKVREEAVNKSKAIYLKTYIFLSGVGGDKSKVKMRATSIFQVVRNTTPNITLNVLKLFDISLMLIYFFYPRCMILCPTERISGAAVTSSTNLTIEGNSVNLTCDAAAGSNLTRLWRKDDSDLILTDNMALNEESRVLSFKSLSKTDSGKYSCEISNPVSNDRVQYIMIVNYGPENVQIDGPSKIDFGKTLTLTCSAESEPSASYTWTLNGTEIHNSSVFTKVITGLSYSGNYTCQAMNNITERRSSAVHQVTVTGNKIPLIASIHQLSSANVFKQPVQAFCSVSSGSSLSFLWMNSSSEVTASDRVQLTDGNSTLTIVNVTRYDLGPFMCVFNPVSNDNMALTVNGNNSTSFSVGSNLTMLCSAQSNPPALLQWAVRGELVNTTGPLLELFSVSEDQSGPYSCLAFNNHTNMNSTITTNIMISSGFVCILTSTSIPYLSICSQLHPHFALFTQSQDLNNRQSVWLLPLLLLFGPFF
uniref:Ig-like domain-containing protein n=1 Tax=Sparus aurata TaxID=8175 RepID=A0A671WD07_SPAAU